MTELYRADADLNANSGTTTELLALPHVTIGQDPHYTWLCKLVEQIERAAQKYSARPLGEAQDWCQTQKYLIQIGQNPKAPDAPTGFLGVSEAGIKAVRKDYQAALTDIRIRIDALTRNTRGADAEKASLRQLQGALQELEPWSRVSDAQDADDVETSVDGPAADDDDDDEL